MNPNGLELSAGRQSKTTESMQNNDMMNEFFRRLARDSTVFLKNDYSLHEDVKAGEYNLQIKIVKFERDNGQFFCSLLDRESGEQILSTPATVMVVGKFFSSSSDILLHVFYFIFERKKF